MFLWGLWFQNYLFIINWKPKLQYLIWRLNAFYTSWSLSWEVASKCERCHRQIIWVDATWKIFGKCTAQPRKQVLSFLLIPVFFFFFTLAKVYVSVCACEREKESARLAFVIFFVCMRVLVCAWMSSSLRSAFDFGLGCWLPGFTKCKMGQTLSFFLFFPPFIWFLSLKTRLLRKSCCFQFSM